MKKNIISFENAFKCCLTLVLSGFCFYVFHGNAIVLSISFLLMLSGRILLSVIMKADSIGKPKQIGLLTQACHFTLYFFSLMFISHLMQFAKQYQMENNQILYIGNLVLVLFFSFLTLLYFIFSFMKMDLKKGKSMG